MGKKRRLNSAKAKFSAKHASHPRAQYLNSQEEVVEEVVMAITTKPEVVIVAASLEPEVVMPPVPPEPEVILQEEVVKKAPKAAPKRKRAKKAPAKGRRTKKTATQDATT